MSFLHLPQIDVLIALGVFLSTAVTDAVYVFFNAAVSARKRVAAASWSSAWYMLSAFAVISYTSNWAYVLFAALGAWIGGYLSITALDWASPIARR
ncbi:MAG TPA: hypothetical protein PKA55_15690 [Rhodoblastus sp.]|nr:hypothetical protein [Rhodoblastus sp.]